MKIETEVKVSSPLPIDKAKVFVHVLVHSGVIWRKAEFDAQGRIFLVDYSIPSCPIIERVEPQKILEWHYYSDEPPAE